MDTYELQRQAKNLEFLEKLCLHCGIGFKDLSGLCPKCKKENLEK